MGKIKSRIQAKANIQKSEVTLAFERLAQRKKILAERYVAQYALWKASDPHSGEDDAEFRRLTSEVSALTKRSTELMRSMLADSQPVLNTKAPWRNLSKLVTPNRRREFKFQLRQLQEKRLTRDLPAMTGLTDEYEAAMITLETFVREHPGSGVEEDTGHN